MHAQTMQGMSASGHRGPQVLAVLSTIYGPEEIGQLYDYFHHLSKEEIKHEVSKRRRDSLPLSDSQRSSIFSVVSSFSSISASSWDATDNASANPDSSVHGETGPDHPHHDMLRLQTNPALPTHFSRRNHDTSCLELPTPSSCADNDSESYVCITCRKRFRHKNSLARHRLEKCESGGVYHCYVSATHRQPFERLETLRKHFDTSHKDVCLGDCSSSHCSHVTKLDLKAAFRPLPTKRAWPCPVCKSCFDTCEQWHRHEKSHLKDIAWGDSNATDITVTGWSKHNLIESLLFKSKFLQAATGRYNWDRCSWPLNEQAHRSLIFALERQTLPEDVASLAVYAGLATADKLSGYAFRMGLTGKPAAPTDLAPYRRSAIGLGSPYRPTRSTSFTIPPDQRHANSSPHSLATGYFPGHSYPSQLNDAPVGSQIHRNVPSQQLGVGLGERQDARSDRHPQESSSLTQDSQRTKLGGFIKGAIRRERSRTNINLPQDKLTTPPVPDLPPETPMHYTTGPADFSWLDITPVDTDIGPCTPGNEAGLLPNQHAANTGPPKAVHNARERAEDKQSSRMSWAPGLDAGVGPLGSDIHGHARYPPTGDSYDEFASFIEDW